MHLFIFFIYLYELFAFGVIKLLFLVATKRGYDIFKLAHK